MHSDYLTLKKKLFVALILGILCQVSCKTASETNSEKIINVVGEIFSDETLDDPNFKICNAQNEIIQYYAFDEKTYSGEKSIIMETFKNEFIPNADLKDSGWVRIRFIVNCEGKAGRFRVSGIDKKYSNSVFDPEITSQLLTITKSLMEWKPMESRGIKRDYYQYLLIKIEHGKILEILP